MTVPLKQFDNPLDSPHRSAELQKILHEKFALRQFYLKAYKSYARSLESCPKSGMAVEIGSGAGFVKEIIPEIITSDILPYPGLDLVLDATKMTFQSGQVRFFGMLNTFHHIPDVEMFLTEVDRCLCPGGRMLIVDQHIGWLSRFIFSKLHNEPFDIKRQEWNFQSSGPLSGANGALTWNVFQRDIYEFQRKFPNLKIHSYQRHSPLIYWLSGGLKKWTLLPKPLYFIGQFFDWLILSLSPDSASFVDIELIKL